MFLKWLLPVGEWEKTTDRVHERGKGGGREEEMPNNLFWCQARAADQFNNILKELIQVIE